VLQHACIFLTGGQHLDLAYESARLLAPEAYWPMIGGKTAALLACCAELGALTARIEAERQCKFHEFGQKLGMAFQVQDDWLGIWGDAAHTGKSTVSDLVSGKKTLPVVFALEKRAAFAERWLRGPLEEQEVTPMAKLLEAEGARQFTEETADRLTREALLALEQAGVQGDGKQALLRLAEALLKRES
jgi:geranylgeranyl diphosphate synthase, type I